MIMICSRPSAGLTKGKRYKVTEATEAHQYNLLLVTDDLGDNYFYSKNRFITEQEWKESLKRMLNRNMVR
jgi:hypothetical protein